MVATKNKPTEKDYKKGFFTRYFAKKENDQGSYFEINKKQYNAIIGKTGLHNHHTHTVRSIKWVIRGESVRKSNFNHINKTNFQYPSLYVLFPKLNEFEQIQIKGNKTDGGELYYSDGSEYVGYYHINPDKGPMVGPEHTEREHEVLFWKYDLQTPKEQKGMVEKEPEELKE